MPSLELTHAYCNHKNISNRKPFQSLKGCSKCEVFSDLNMATEISQGVTPFIKVCKDPQPEDNN